MLIRVADQLVEYIHVASKMSVHCLLDKLLLVCGAISKLTVRLSATELGPVKVS